MSQLLGHVITYRIAFGPQAGRKVFTLQTLPACDPDDLCGDTVGKVAGFSLAARVAAKAHERHKLERLAGISTARRSRENGCCSHRAGMSATS